MKLTVNHLHLVYLSLFLFFCPSIFFLYLYIAWVFAFTKVFIKTNEKEFNQELDKIFLGFFGAFFCLSIFIALIFLVVTPEARNLFFAPFKKFLTNTGIKISFHSPIKIKKIVVAN